MGDVVILDCPTTLHIPPDRVLESAVGKLSEVVLIGYEENGDWYFASSFEKMAEVLLALERAKMDLMSRLVDD